MAKFTPTEYLEAIEKEFQCRCSICEQLPPLSEPHFKSVWPVVHGEVSEVSDELPMAKLPCPFDCGCELRFMDMKVFHPVPLCPPLKETREHWALDTN